MTLVAVTGNAPPNAQAGRDRNALVGGVVTLDGSGSDDPEHAPLSFTWSFVSVPAGSALTDADIFAQGTPTPQFIPDVAGTYGLNLQVSDGVLTDEDTVQVFASHPNVGPNANAGLDRAITVGRVVTLDGSGSFDLDAGPSPLSFSWVFVALPAGSALTNADLRDATTATPSFTPDVEGAYVLRLTVRDGEESDADNVLIEVVVNQPPEAVADTAATTEDTHVTINVLVNDTDPDGDPLTLTSVSQGAHGTVVDNPDGTLTYTPAANFNGTDTFTYTISDGQGGTDTATVMVTVKAVNDAPVAVTDNYSIDEDTPLNVSAPGVLGNDTDADGDALTAILVSGPSHGTLVLNADGSFTYTPTTNFSGIDTFTYTIRDGQGGIGTATVTVTVTPVNDAPVLAPIGEQTVLVGRTLTLMLTASDPDGDPLLFAASPLSLPPNASLDATTGVFTFTPAADQVGTITLTFSVSDGSLTDAETITIVTVPPEEPPPVTPNRGSSTVSS